MRHAVGIAARLDPQSRQAIQRFALLIALFALWSATVGRRRPLAVFAFMSFIAAWVELGLAAFRHEKILAASLGRWDLAAAFFGLHCLAEALA